ncbi:MAG: acyltransferase, partial [Duncaniella sp.]|nr:acyltransferase [Duncaniella sp.]
MCIRYWFVAGPQGEILFRASDSEEEMAIVDIDLKRSEQVRRWWPFLRDRRIDDFSGLTKRYLD